MRLHSARIRAWMCFLSPSGDINVDQWLSEHSAVYAGVCSEIREVSLWLRWEEFTGVMSVLPDKGMERRQTAAYKGRSEEAEAATSLPSPLQVLKKSHHRPSSFATRRRPSQLSGQTWLGGVMPSSSSASSLSPAAAPVSFLFLIHVFISWENAPCHLSATEVKWPAGCRSTSTWRGSERSRTLQSDQGKSGSS